MFRKIIKYLLSFLLFYFFAGFFLFPFLKPQLVKEINQQVNANVTIESIAFNPLLFAVKISDFHLYTLDKKPLLSFSTLSVNIDPSYLLIGAAKIKSFTLHKPKIYLTFDKQKELNFAKIVKSTPQKESQSDEESSLPLRIIIDRVILDKGELFFNDFTHKTPFSISLENMGFWLKRFDTKKPQKEVGELRFYAKLGDEGFIDFKSTIRDLKPFKIEGQLGFAANKLYTEWRYLQDILHLEVADGKISLKSHFTFNSADINATEIDVDEMTLKALRIKPKEKGKNILALKSLRLSTVKVLPLQKNVSIQSVKINGLNIDAKRYASGDIDWIEYIKVDSDEANKTELKGDPWRLHLQSLDLQKFAFVFEDETVVPHVKTDVNKLSLQMKNITLAGDKPLDYKLKFFLNRHGECDSYGSLIHKKLDLSMNFECNNLDLVSFRPYINKAARKNLQHYDLLLQSALLDFTGSLKVVENNNSYISMLHDSNVSIKKLGIQKRTTRENITKFHNFTMSGIELNTQNRELNVSQIVLNKLAVNLMRQKSGLLNIEGLVVPKKGKQTKKKDLKKSQGYRVRMKKVMLKNARVDFLDKTVQKRAKNRLDRMNITLYNVDSKKRSWLNYKASLRVNRKGYLYAKGKLRHTPLSQRGSLRADKISLVSINPYLQEQSFLRLDDGFLSFKVDEHYQVSKTLPDLSMHGRIGVQSLFVTDTNDANSSLLSLNKLLVKPFTLELFPNRLYVDNILVDSFYVNAKIDENKTLNFSQLMKVNKGKEREIQKNTTKKEVFPVKIVKVDVQNGSAAFEDLSLPIKFKTNIHDLKGVLYALSNNPGDTSYVNIDGEVDKYGSTKLKGSIDSSDPKDYTDLDFNFKNLDLHAMSGYSASFAGYEIDSGKLYLDLGYLIKNAELNASNSIIIKQIKLGKELEGENINHLPLHFVIGLLEDSDGIIDIDMPIEGNVDKPDFKYGALVWKTLGNLIAKAVTSPFKFLGSMMGLNGEDLEFIAFEFGKSNITPPQREKLDKIAKLMLKRPKINLQIAATYDDTKDLEALKLQKLIVMVMKESGEQNSKNAKTALTVDVLENVYNTLRDDDALVDLRKKLHKKYEGKIYQRAYQQALLERCIEIQDVNASALEKLAKTRAEVVQNYLVSQKNVDIKRVLFGKSVRLHNADDKGVNMKLDIEIESKDK